MTHCVTNQAMTLDQDSTPTTSTSSCLLATTQFTPCRRDFTAMPAPRPLAQHRFAYVPTSHQPQFSNALTAWQHIPIWITTPLTNCLRPSR
eukprot:3419591-Rhodomonas_salina.2